MKRSCNNERVVWNGFACRGVGYVWNQRDMQLKSLWNGFITFKQVHNFTIFILATTEWQCQMEHHLKPAHLVSLSFPGSPSNDASIVRSSHRLVTPMLLEVEVEALPCFIVGCCSIHCRTVLLHSLESCAAPFTVGLCCALGLQEITSFDTDRMLLPSLVGRYSIHLRIMLCI